MRRTQIQFDDETYAAVRERAFATRRSMSSVVRESVGVALKLHRTPVATIDRFSFVGSGRSQQQRGRPVSAHHDDALAEAIAPARTRRR